ncbi:MAG: hypothetical protein LBT56_04475 [Prevotellaceae bacterium]|jgi:hypothetical protein|nr:hypothetical protein [Prevotellaceae bacterium]
MRKKLSALSVGFLGLFLLNACTTYLIPIDSFKQQFIGIDSTMLKQVTVQDALGKIYTYLANPIKTIQCMDKAGKPHELENKPSIEIRFTYGEKNKKTILYFDRVFLNDSIITGAPSRFIPSLVKNIPLKEVTKIEIQDGGKKFRYIEK